MKANKLGRCNIDVVYRILRADNIRKCIAVKNYAPETIFDTVPRVYKEYLKSYTLHKYHGIKTLCLIVEVLLSYNFFEELQSNKLIVERFPHGLMCAQLGDFTLKYAEEEFGGYEFGRENVVGTEFGGRITLVKFMQSWMDDKYYKKIMDYEVFEREIKNELRETYDAVNDILSRKEVA